MNCTGKNDSIGLKYNNNFFIHKLQTNIRSNDMFVSHLLTITKKHNLKIDKTLSIIVNVGPGSFSAIRTSLTVAKGLQLSRGAKLYGYNNSDLVEFNLKNIELLIKKNLLENKLIKPVYLS
jgi:tRNA A37 threonylcarbamoyladenosine modification protein TsaB|tara:strand:- start:639 stop:1001 length:363 start_codon:yes stop_codon:yes gene_type:complete